MNSTLSKATPTRIREARGIGLVWITLTLAGVSDIAIADPLSTVETRSSGAQTAQPPAESADDAKQLKTFEGYIRENRLQELVPLLEAYLKVHPRSWRGYYQLGYVYFRLHQISASVEALAKSLQLNVRNAEAHKILGLNLTIVSKFDEAQLELEEAVRLQPGSAEMHYFLGRVYYVKNVFPLAKREFETAIRLDPSYMKAHNSLGLTLEAVLDDTAALASYRKAIELNERQENRSEWPYINVCAFYIRLNQPALALEYCRMAVEVNPQSDQAHFDMARAYMARQEFEPALKHLEKAVEINPGASKFRYVLSGVYRKLGKIEESQREVEAFRKLSAQELETFRRMSGREMGGAAREPMEEPRRTPDAPSYRKQ